MCGAPASCSETIFWDAAAKMLCFCAFSLAESFLDLSPAFLLALPQLVRPPGSITPTVPAAPLAHFWVNEARFGICDHTPAPRCQIRFLKAFPRSSFTKWPRRAWKIKLGDRGLCGSPPACCGGWPLFHNAYEISWREVSPLEGEVFELPSLCIAACCACHIRVIALVFQKRGGEGREEPESKRTERRKKREGKEKVSIRCVQSMFSTGATKLKLNAVSWKHFYGSQQKFGSSGKLSCYIMLHISHVGPIFGFTFRLNPTGFYRIRPC